MKSDNHESGKMERLEQEKDGQESKKVYPDFCLMHADKLFQCFSDAAVLCPAHWVRWDCTHSKWAT